MTGVSKWDKWILCILLLSTVGCGKASFQAASLSSSVLSVPSQTETADTPSQPTEPSEPSQPPDPGGVEAPLPVTAPTIYVSPQGQDRNPGTQELPVRTIQKGVSLAKPGMIVSVAPGSYPETIKTQVSGTADAPIRIVSAVKGGAKIRPQSNAEAIWENSGDYVQIEGFEVDGSISQANIGIYAHGSHVKVIGNYVHHVYTAKACSNHGGGGIVGEGYYGDIDVQIIGNHIHDIGPENCAYVHGVYHTGTGAIVNNLIYRIRAVGIHLWHDPYNILIANNTVFNSDYGILIGAGDWYHPPQPADYITVINNIVYQNRTRGIAEEGVSGTHNVYKNNLSFGNQTNWRLQNGMKAENSITADPLFVNYLADGGGNYHLQASSPARGKGVLANAPATDYDGRDRIKDGQVDIGAFEN